MSALSALSLLRAHLEQRLSHGQRTVGLSKEARLAMRALIQSPLARRGAEPQGAGETRSLATSSMPFDEPQPSARPRVSSPGQGEPGVAAAFADAFRELRQDGPGRQDQTARPMSTPVAASTAVAAGENAEPAAAARILEVPGGSLEERLAYLAAMAEVDPRPRALGSLRPTMVFATGSPRSAVMFVGEAPGAEEENQREPFVGAAGQLLTKIIGAMGLKRPEVYISNICKFRPSQGPHQGMGNRPPTPEEMQVCLPYILTEVDLIKPKVIVALGATAATGLGIEGPVGKNRGRFHSAAGAQVMVTYHPSYLIREEQRDGGLKAKRLVWEDMLAVMERLELPISEKQRGYFRSAG